MSAIRLYRIAHWLYLHHMPLLPWFFYRLIYLINNCHVHYKTEIGEGSVLGYGGIGVVIHERVVIGKNCMISSNVTIGGRSNIFEVPVLGDNVYVGTGARILGAIKIGDNAVIGANAVVIKDVPPNCTAAGVPARLLSCDIIPDKKTNSDGFVMN